jgi:hypothetical protein
MVLCKARSPALAVISRRLLGRPGPNQLPADKMRAILALFPSAFQDFVAWI